MYDEQLQRAKELNSVLDCDEMVALAFCMVKIGGISNEKLRAVLNYATGKVDEWIRMINNKENVTYAMNSCSKTWALADYADKKGLRRY